MPPSPTADALAADVAAALGAFSNIAVSRMIQAALDAAADAARIAEQRRCVEEAAKLRRHATCKKVARTCTALIERFQGAT